MATARKNTTPEKIQRPAPTKTQQALADREHQNSKRVGGFWSTIHATVKFRFLTRQVVSEKTCTLMVMNVKPINTVRLIFEMLLVLKNCQWMLWMLFDPMKTRWQVLKCANDQRQCVGCPCHCYEGKYFCEISCSFGKFQQVKLNKEMERCVWTSSHHSSDTTLGASYIKGATEKSNLHWTDFHRYQSELGREFS